jgi:peptidylprolyl isomerase
MAYGIRSIPDRPDHPGIPAKSDLVFDVELVEVTDMPAPAQGPIPPMGARPQPGQPGTAPHPNPPVEGKPVEPDASKPDVKPASPPAPGQPAQPAPPSTPPQPK